MKPIIGIVLRPEISPESNELMCMYKEVSTAIIKNGGIPIGICPTSVESYYGGDIKTTNELTKSEFADLKRIVDLCDGIVCQGGDNYYDYDIKIIKYAHFINKPLLGICLGMQAMSAAFNGELQPINNLSHSQKGHKYVHEVLIKEPSKLFNILRKHRINVNSRHKWKVVKTDLNVVGVTCEVIEAVEDSNKEFFIGVEWHPESMIVYDKTMNNLFKEFLSSCSSKIN